MAIPYFITKELFENALQQYLKNNNVRVVNVSNSLAAGKSDSYNSNPVRSIIIYTTGKDGNKDTLTVVVKCCPVSNDDPLEITNDMRFFQKEIEMYTDILPEVHRILGNLGTLSPECIFIESLPIRLIMMKDLKVEGFKMANRRDGLDLEHCKMTVKKLAQLHAASLAIQAKKPRSFSNYYQALYPGNSGITFWIKLAIGDIMKAIDKRPGMEKYILKLKRIQDSIIEECAEAIKPSSNFINVLNHGDCWTNNIMFQYDCNEKLKDLRLIDFQVGIHGSPSIDLQYFWATSPSLEVRKKHLNTILDYYYSQLIETLNAIKYNSNKVPPKEDFRKDWFSKLHYGFAGAVTVLAVSKSEDRNDASVATLFDPEQTHEGTFRHHLYNNDAYWSHLDYLLNFYDSHQLFDA